MEDPTIRRRQGREAMNDRDAEVLRRRQSGQSFRTIGRELGMPASSVQRCLARALKREQKLTDAVAGGQPGDVLAADCDDELKCADVTSHADIERLSDLEVFRLGAYARRVRRRRAGAARS